MTGQDVGESRLPGPQPAPPRGLTNQALQAGETSGQHRPEHHRQPPGSRAPDGPRQPVRSTT